MKCAVILAVAILVNFALADEWAPDPLCPYPSEDLTFYPDPEDCANYFECYEGDKYVITCPVDMFWDTSASTCVAKEGVNCGDRGATTTKPVLTTTTSPATAVTGTVDPTAWTPDPLCPYPSEDLTFYRNVENCAQYWECYEGNRYLITCPNDLLWNDNTKACDDKRNVNCDTITTTSPNTGPTQPVDPTAWTPDPLCPYPSEDLTFYPNLDNCSQYWECYEGNKYLITCPNDLLWNDKTNTCDDKRNVNCDRTITTNSPNTGPTQPGDERCAGQPNGSFHANPNDCSKFYECDEGKAIDEECPSGTLWNESNLTCDFPYNVNCKTK